MPTPNLLGLQLRFVRAGEGETHVVGSEHVTFLLTGDNADDTFAIGLVTVAPGGGPFPHVHRREDEILIVLSGEIEPWLPTGGQAARPGDVVFLPADVPYGYRNVPGEPARLYVIAHPSGLECYYARLARLSAAPGGPSPRLPRNTASRSCPPQADHPDMSLQDRDVSPPCSGGL